MPQNNTIRVVPSGQIYRQLFDAQFQLNQTLVHFDSESHAHRLKSQELPHGNSLPLVRLDKEEIQHGILTNRQKTWVEGFPNDPYTENPVLHKQYSDFLNQKLLNDTKTSQAGWEVRALPDIIVPAKRQSDIVDRIVERRKQRHEAVMEEMQQTFSSISLGVEPFLEESCTALLAKLAADDKEIEALLSRIEKDEDLMTYKMPDLLDLWEMIQAHTAQRQSWIQEMDSRFKNIEAGRTEKIRKVFTDYGKKLHSVAYLLKPDLQRLLDRESQLINQTVLSNRRSYADLYMRLISADIEREKIQRSAWQKRVNDWKSFNTKLAIESFREFMKTEEVTKPPDVENIRNKLLSDQKVLNNDRIKLIKTLSDMQPPNATEQSVCKWSSDLQELCKELDGVTQMHLSKLHEEYEKTCQMCLDKVDSMKAEMLESGVCSNHKANQVMDEFMLPLVGRQQRVFEQNLETMQEAIEKHTTKIEEEITVLFRTAHGAAQLWDMHVKKLAKREKELQEHLDACRQIHDQENQEREAELDIVMDRMRQDANEIALKDSLMKVLVMLNNIKNFYEEFHEQQTKIAQNYPTAVQEELNFYDHAVCSYFSVSRMVPTLKRPSQHSAQEDNTNRSNEVDRQTNETEDEDEEKTLDTVDFLSVSGQKLTVKSSSQSFRNKTVKYMVQEIIYTSRGTEFGVLMEVKPDTELEIVKEVGEEEVNKDQEREIAFLTELKDDAEEQVEEVPDFIQTIDISKSCFMLVKRAICINFLEHLDDWFEQALLRANSVVVSKCEELNSELDLRLHLHHPRPRRAELDVHNVRAAELVLHAQRVSDHITAMDHRLAEMGPKFRAMNYEQSRLAQKFKEDVEALQDILINATKSSRLVRLQNQIRECLDNFMTDIRASLRQFRQLLDDVVQSMKESNARFIKSFRTFSDGGNFCPEEIEMFRNKLERLSMMIDAREGSVMSDLDNMESRRLESSTKTVTEFEERLKSHITDLVFVEFMTHWLTYSQMKIKSEVASSNSQGQSLEQMLIDLERKITALKNPNLDQGQIAEIQLNETLLAIFDACVRRSEYLRYKKTAKNDRPSSINTIKGTVTYERKSSGGALIDPTVMMIKSILTSIEISRRKLPEYSGSQNDQKGVTKVTEQNGSVSDITSEKHKPSMVPRKGSEHKSSNKVGDSTGEEVTKKSQSGFRRFSRLTKFDRKSVVFGNSLDDRMSKEGDVRQFLLAVQHILREACDVLLSSADAFYQQKGGRAIVRPQTIPETFDLCAENISQKLQSYLSQAEEYCNQCLQEFRNQLVRLEETCACIPSVIFANLLREEIKKSKDSQEELARRFQTTLGQLADRQKSNLNKLRPTLGHPNNAESLAVLCALESDRHKEHTEVVARYIEERQECALGNANAFLEKLQNTSEFHLLMYDGMLVVDDVERGKTESKQYMTSKLIRRSMADEPLVDEAERVILPRGKATWTGFPSNQFVIGDSPSSLEITQTIQTGKTTLAHSATVQARDKAYEEYHILFEKTVQEIGSLKDKLIMENNCWIDSWATSVEKIKQLYKKDD